MLLVSLYFPGKFNFGPVSYSPSTGTIIKCVCVFGKSSALADLGEP